EIGENEKTPGAEKNSVPGARAGGGLRTRMVRGTSSVPFWSRATPAEEFQVRISCFPLGTWNRKPGTPSAGGQGFEPCEAVLEAACSPRSILLLRPLGRERRGTWVGSERHQATDPTPGPQLWTRRGIPARGAGGGGPPLSAFTKARAAPYPPIRLR